MSQTLFAPPKPQRSSRPRRPAEVPEPTLREVLAEVEADGLDPLERSFVVAAYLLATAVGRTTFVGECRVVAEVARDFPVATEDGFRKWLDRLGPAVLDHEPEFGFWDGIITAGLYEDSTEV